MASAPKLSFCQAHQPGLCDVAWLPTPGAAAVLVTAGGEGRVCYRTSESPAEAVKEIQNSNNGAAAPVHCVAAAQGRPVITGDDQNFVKCYTHPAGELQQVATRFTLPVHGLAFSPSGLILAAGGDDEGIKLVDISSCRVFRQLKSQAYTRSLAYDPEGKYLASANADGGLCMWEIESGKQQLHRKKACPKLDLASRCRNQVAWHPDGGSLLAAPGIENDIVLYERMSWAAAITLSGQHSGMVSLLAFSSNGLYLLSAGLDKALVLWDVNEQECLVKAELPGLATGLAWHPTRNEVAVITEDGQLAIWDGVVPAKLPGPTADLDAINGVKNVDGGGIAAGTAAGGGMADGGSVLEGGGRTGTAAGASDEYDREDSFLADSEPKRDARRGGRRPGGFGGFSSFDLPQPQDPIQPGSTSLSNSERAYLAYNSLGCITLKQEEDHNVVEVCFHDTSRQRKRIPLLNDFFGFSVGSLGEKGALYACRTNSESASTVVYRPFESWAANSDWSISLPKGEEAECVAAGASFCAVATSKRQLRLFSQAGLQMHLISLAGAPVALAALGHQLVAVWHSAAPTASGDQCLQYMLLDVAEQRQLHGGPLPLSRAASLCWLGFTEEGLMATYDSEGELRLRAADFGGSWVTVFSAAAERKSTEQFWVVGLSARELQAIVCVNAPEPVVSTGMQRPVVTAVPLKPPVVHQDAAIAPFEADLIRHGVLLSHMSGAAAEGRDGEERGQLESALQGAQLESDRISLRLIQKLLAADRQARALEVSCTLHNMPALEGALKLANHHRAMALSDRISAFIEQRMAMEAAAALEVEEAEQYQQYQDDAPPHSAQRQHGAITPVPGPSFTDNPHASPAAAATAGDMSRAASPPASRPLGPGMGTSANPFSRRPAEQPENSPGNASVAAVPVKRKAPAGGNPFARKSKASKA
ncbi:hypothetical protein D9Q98_004782 [Chlorella vulgaris]|uniref:Minichromosome loss protein Mcl1 middle region domain-containing protein n=1 Tax=Chlorella vulgaris TaxID=3077 RepID=A0A9D4TQN4_CHLVU|nr:hypothetical protein D9Q98_004782 [Chlorella vulgaris]